MLTAQTLWHDEGNHVRRMYGKQTIMKTPDMSNVKWTKAQKEHRQRFKKAVIYARVAMADPVVRAKYEKIAAKTGRRSFHLAISDFFQGKNLLEKP
jgi:predicted double-glycine peptidase